MVTMGVSLSLGCGSNAATCAGAGCGGSASASGSATASAASSGSASGSGTRRCGEGGGTTSGTGGTGGNALCVQTGHEGACSMCCASDDAEGYSTYVSALIRFCACTTGAACYAQCSDAGDLCSDPSAQTGSNGLHRLHRRRRQDRPLLHGDDEQRRRHLRRRPELRRHDHVLAGVHGPSHVTGGGERLNSRPRARSMIVLWTSRRGPALNTLARLAPLATIAPAPARRRPSSSPPTRPAPATDPAR